MSTAKTRVRRMSPTERRLYLLDHGWDKDRNANDWSHPVHGRRTLAAAIRIALGGEPS